MSGEIFDFVGDTVGNLVNHAIAVPQHIFEGEFDKIPGDIFNNAVDIGGAALTGGTGSFFGDLAANAAVGAAGSFGKSLFEGSGNTGTPSPKAAGPAAPAPFQPKQEDALALPGSLSGLSGLSPLQVGTNIASQGVYGGGEGPEESNYFLNMAQRRLVDPQGKVDSNYNDFAPVELGYLDQLGYGGNKKPQDLLQALSGRFG